MPSLLLPSCLRLTALVAASTAVAVAQTSTPHDLRLPNPALRLNPAEMSLGAVAVEPEIIPAEAEIIRGLIEVVQTNPRQAIQALQAVVTPASSAMMDFILGNLHFQLDERAQALRYYQNAIRKFPNFVRAHKNLGFLALQSEQFDEALRSFVRTIELGSREGAVFGLVGFIYLNRENFLAAESAYRHAVMKLPDTLDWRLGLARTFVAQERHEDSLGVMRELLMNDPKRSEFWLVKSNAFIALNRPMDAAFTYEIMGRLGLGTRDTFNALGNIYLSQDKTPLALRSYLLAIDLPERPTMDTILSGAEIMAARGSIAEAEVLADRILAVYEAGATTEQKVRLHRLRSQIFLAQDDRARAERSLARLIELDPDDGQTLLLLANFYARAGRYDDAEPLFSRAETLEGFKTQALIQHAQVLVNRGGADSYGRAIELLERSQNIDPQDRVARYLEQVRRIYRSARF